MYTCTYTHTHTHTLTLSLSLSLALSLSPVDVAISPLVKSDLVRIYIASWQPSDIDPARSSFKLLGPRDLIIMLPRTSTLVCKVLDVTKPSKVKAVK